MTPTRMFVVLCPDWPVVAAVLEGAPARGPVAVLGANRVVACSPTARAGGVTVGLRRREAQQRCPELVAVGHDPVRDARAFEPVIAAVEQVVAGVEVVRPGCCAFAARGPSRYFGGEEAAAERILEQIGQETGAEATVGVADGGFAAEQAARQSRIVPVGRTAAFLAALDVGVLGRPELVSRLRRLGLVTLGDFAALPAGDVLARFGFDAALAQRWAGGADCRLLAVRRPPPELVVAQVFDEPIDRVDVAAFAARALAERLHARLAGHGLACTRLEVSAVTADGQELRRVWRHDGLLTTAAVTDRVRWQLEGWLAGSGGSSRPGAGVAQLRLAPAEVVSHVGLQPGLWGETGDGRDRAHRAFARVQGLLGPEAVVTAVLQGGRGPVDRVRLVPWGDAREARSEEAPWPGRLPPPSPVSVPDRPWPAEVTDAAGGRVTVDGRLRLSAPPARVRWRDGPPAEIVGWAGPWPADERWWAPAEASRLVRFQVSLGNGRALLLVLAAGQWAVEASYD